MALENTNTKSVYAGRTKAGNNLSEFLKETYGGSVDVEIEDLSCTITIPYDKGRSIIVNWNVPIQIILSFDAYHFGSDYIKNDTEWNEITEAIKLVVGAIKQRNGYEVMVNKKGKQYKLALKLKVNEKTVVLPNPNRPFLTLFSKKTKVNL